MMSLRKFLRNLDVQGSDVSRWPRRAREEAQRLIATNPQARTAHAAAENLVSSIARSRTIREEGRNEIPVRRVLARLHGPLPRQRRALLAGWWPATLLGLDFAPDWSRCAALASIAMLGFVIGLSGIAGPLTSGSLLPNPSVTSDSDLSMIVFEADPLTSLRP